MTGRGAPTPSRPEAGRTPLEPFSSSWSRDPGTPGPGVPLSTAVQIVLPDRCEALAGEAYSFLRAVNSRHPGSITTVHADSPKAALEQIALMVMLKGVNLGRAEIVDYVFNVVDVAIQLARTDGRGPWPHSRC